MATPATSRRVSEIIHELNSSINAFIQTEIAEIKTADLNPKIEAAINVSIAIENAKNCYDSREVLGCTLDKVDESVRRQLTECQDMVEVIKSRNSILMQGLARRTQALVQSLQLAKWQPQLIAVDPNYVIISNERFHVSFLGQFHYAATNRVYEFVLSNQRYAVPLVSTGDKLSFVVPIPTDLLHYSAFDHCHFMQGTLNVTYKNGWMPNQLKRASFNIWIRAFPLKIGEITAFYSNKHVITREFTSVGMRLKRHDRHRIFIEPSRGWRIVPNTPVLLSNGNPPHPLQPDQYNERCVDLKLELTPESESREVQVKFQETQEVVEETEFSRSIELKWGQEHVLRQEPGIQLLRIECASFDRQKFIITGPDETKPYLKAKKCEGGLRLIAEAPQQI